MKGSRLWWIGGGLVIGCTLLALSLRNVDIGDSLRVLRGVDLVYLLFTVAAGMTFVFVKTWRWQILLRPSTPITNRALLAPVFAATGVNLLIPHAGELVRVMAMRNRVQTSGGFLLLSIGIERAFDFISVCALLGIAIAVRPGLQPVIVSVGYAALALASVSALALAWLWRYPQSLLAVVHFCTRILPGKLRAFVERHVTDGVNGVAPLRGQHVLVWVCVASLLQWSSIVLAIVFSTRAVDIDAGVAAATIVLGLMVVGLTLPAAPMNAGTTQAAFAIGLAGFSVSMPAAFAASLVYTAGVIVPELLVGLLCLYGAGFQLRSAVGAGGSS
jgi:uncharacterized protein (TIRG00374 family)